MHVICIDASKSKKWPNIIVPLIEGAQYEVFESPYPNNYIVKGLEINKEYNNSAHFLKSRFILLSEIDETELIKERHEYETTSVL